MVSLQLRDAIADSFAVILDSYCFEVYATPAFLQAFVLSNLGASLLDVYLPTLVHAHMGTLHQALGSIVLLLLFDLSIVPSWYVGDALAGLASIKSQSLGADATFRWVFLPIVIPTWMVSPSPSLSF